MDDSLSTQQSQTVKQSMGKSPDEGNAKALEVVLLYQFIEIHPEGENGANQNNAQGR